MTLSPSLATPAPLLARGLVLRPEEPGDEAALRDLYIRHRWDEFSALPWPDAQKAALLAQQFAIRRHQYRTNWPRSSFLVVIRGTELAGHLYFAETPDDLHLIDILLDTAWRGQGLGGALLRALAEFAGSRRTLTLQVLKDNPARALYRRLDFAEVADLGHALLMRLPERLAAH